MTTFIVCLVVGAFTAVIVFALTLKGNVKARFKLPFVDFSLETEDRKR